MAEDHHGPETIQADTAHRLVFKQRRTRQRTADALAFAGIEGTILFAFFGNRAGVPSMNLYCYSVLIFFGVLIVALVFTQVNWRCPACSKSLASARARIDSFFTPEPLNCPHCGTKLL
jgi:DNA-directed RNA polymerase subunit RPC12/RpoP